jgi:hypothetical protein
MVNNHINNDQLAQKISVPLRPGDHVTVWAETVEFDGTVSRHNPKTGLLEFEDSSVGRAEFLELVEGAEEIRLRSP